MPTPHAFDGTITLVANTGGATVGTIYKNADGVVYLAMTTAVSGTSVVGKIDGRVNGVNKISATAWTAGQPLAHDGTAFTHVVSATRVVANAHVAAASAATTGDVILCLPGTLAPV